MIELVTQAQRTDPKSPILIRSTAFKFAQCKVDVFIVCRSWRIACDVRADGCAETGGGKHHPITLRPDSEHCLLTSHLCFLAKPVSLGCVPRSCIVCLVSLDFLSRCSWFRVQLESKVSRFCMRCVVWLDDARLGTSVMFCIRSFH